MKSSFSMHEPRQKVCILKAINVSVSYPDGHPVNPKKIADFQKMIPFLPLSCRDFYSTLADHPVSSNSDDDGHYC